jgi:hypothetical protein
MTEVIADGLGINLRGAQHCVESTDAQGNFRQRDGVALRQNAVRVTGVLGCGLGADRFIQKLFGGLCIVERRGHSALVEWWRALAVDCVARFKPAMLIVERFQIGRRPERRQQCAQHDAAECRFRHE